MKNRNSSTKDDLTYEETTFFGMFRIVGIEELKNWSIWWAFLITLWTIIFIIHNSKVALESFSNVSNLMVGTLLGASASIFSIVIAALSVSVTLFHKSLLPRMLKNKLLHSFLFPFWFAVTLWGFNIVICILLYIFQAIQQKCFIPPFFSIELFLFLFSTFYTISLTGLVIRFALQRAQIEE